MQILKVVPFLILGLEGVDMLLLLFSTDFTSNLSLDVSPLYETFSALFTLPEDQESEDEVCPILVFLPRERAQALQARQASQAVRLELQNCRIAPRLHPLCKCAVDSRACRDSCR